MTSNVRPPTSSWLGTAAIPHSSSSIRERNNWTRRGIAEWRVERLAEPVPTLVAIDHGFSFPLRYVETHHLPPDWPASLDDVQRHRPTDGDYVYVDFVRDGLKGHGTARMGDARWRRLTEVRAGGARSEFHLDVPGSVANTTHAGPPWLRFIRQQLGARVRFWPFDGWNVPAGCSAIVEVYPALWSRNFARQARTGDQKLFENPADRAIELKPSVPIGSLTFVGGTT